MKNYGCECLIGLSYPDDAFIMATFNHLEYAFNYAAEMQAKSDYEWSLDGQENVNVFTVIDNFE